VAGRPRKQAEQDSSAVTGARGQPTKPGEQRKTTELGLSNLDVGWLNTRSGHVGREMEAELWEKARIFLDELEGEDKNCDRDDDGDKAPDDLEIMEL